jgi:hypothetical protein
MHGVLPPLEYTPSCVVLRRKMSLRINLFTLEQTCIHLITETYIQSRKGMSTFNYRLTKLAFSFLLIVIRQIFVQVLSLLIRRFVHFCSTSLIRCRMHYCGRTEDKCARICRS